MRWPDPSSRGCSHGCLRAASGSSRAVAGRIERAAGGRHADRRRVTVLTRAQRAQAAEASGFLVQPLLDGDVPRPGEMFSHDWDRIASDYFSEIISPFEAGVPRRLVRVLDAVVGSGRKT